MNGTIVHLSDIHLNESRNVILNRKEKIFDSIRNEIKGKDFLFIITTGDIAFSGKTKEYLIAKKFYKYLYDSLKEYTALKSFLIFIPGNHDCQFSSDKEVIRKVLLKNFIEHGFSEINEGQINICCEPLSNFFQFRDDLQTKQNVDVVYDNKLLRVLTFKIDNKIIKFNCYNTSWHSVLKEKQGDMSFPIAYLNDQIQSINNDLTISLLHHPFNWQTPESSREFRETLLNTSEVVITGHEHINEKGIFSDFQEDFTTILVSSGALQETNEHLSFFNLINLNLIENKIQIKYYSYDEKGSYKIEKEEDWKDIKKNKKLKTKPFQIKKAFLADLENPGAPFIHPSAKEEINLSDLFIAPYLNNISLTKDKQTRFLNFIPSSSVFDISNAVEDSTFLKVIFGNESSGKTTLLKHHYIKYFQSGFFPILFTSDQIDEISEEGIKKNIKKIFLSQYDELDQSFDQIDFRKIIILIDDFHKMKYKKQCPSYINHVCKIFSKIIITGNELMQFETFTNKTNKKIDIFDSFDKYIVQEFNPTLRDQLVNKWFRIGNDYIEENERVEFFKKINHAEETISNIIGKNLIPAYPIYVLTILQSISGLTPDNNADNLHGYYYESLITKSIKFALLNKSDIGFYMSVSKEYFYFLFINRIRFEPLGKADFMKFLKGHFTKYNLEDINHENVLTTLINGKILKINSEGYISVTYKYIYYFFTAKYIADNIEDEKIKETFNLMADRVYREEYSNIIIFLTHLSKSNFIIEKLIEKAKKIFEGLEIVKLESDIEFINNLQKILPEKVIQNLSIEDSRKEELESNDEYEADQKQFEEAKKELEQYDLYEDFNGIDLISQITKAVRTTNILGQITKKYWGEISGPNKNSLAEETFFLSLRTLKFYFNLMGDNTELLVEHIKGIISKRFAKENLTNPDIENISSNFIFNLSTAATFGIIKRTANSIGSEKLSKTFEDIEENHPFNSIKLINMGIKLDHQSFPQNEIVELASENSNNPLGFAALQNLVIDHLYMYDESYDKKQMIYEKLKIKIKDQEYIQKTSKIKKSLPAKVS